MMRVPNRHLQQDPLRQPSGAVNGLVVADLFCCLCHRYGGYSTSDGLTRHSLREEEVDSFLRGDVANQLSGESRVPRQSSLQASAERPYAAAAGTPADGACLLLTTTKEVLVVEAPLMSSKTGTLVLLPAGTGTLNPSREPSLQGSAVGSSLLGQLSRPQWPVRLTKRGHTEDERAKRSCNSRWGTGRRTLLTDTK